MYHGNRGAGAKPNCRTRNAMSTTQTREARSPLPDQQLLAPLSNLTPSLPGNEAGSPVARRKVASCGADGGDSAHPVGIAPPVTTYKAGESFSELPGDRHSVSANASETEPAKLLAVFVVDTNETELTTPLGN